MLPPELRMIPLDRLVGTDLNVRKTDIDVEIDRMAEDLAAHGVLQNLIVTPVLDDQFGVLDGQRRRLGLLRLVERGAFAADGGVPCLVVTHGADAREISLATAVTRVALNPADEVKAYADVVADHAGEADALGYCSRVFGVPVAYVAQRLRLAALAPEILDALRDGDIGDRAAQAYAGVPDHELQLQVFRQERERSWGPKHEPKNIRDTLRGRTLPADDKRARYVGLVAYEAEGGRIERDLWMLATEPDRLLDPSLLERLAREKAEAELPKLAKRDGFASGRLTVGFPIMPVWPKPPAGYQDANDAPPADAVRIEQGWIGLYELANDTAQLSLRSWWAPVPRQTSEEMIAAAAQRDRESQPERKERLEKAVAVISGAAADERADRLDRAQLELTAARSVALAELGGRLPKFVEWPAADAVYVPMVETRADGTMLVTLQVRIFGNIWEQAVADAVAASAEGQGA